MTRTSRMEVVVAVVIRLTVVRALGTPRRRGRTRFHGLDDDRTGATWRDLAFSMWLRRPVGVIMTPVNPNRLGASLNQTETVRYVGPGREMDPVPRYA